MPSPTQRVLIIIVDGLRADMARSEFMPELAKLCDRGRRFNGHRSVFPTATRVNSASIATGCLPRNHGLLGNAIALDEGRGLEPVSVGPADFRERWRRATGATLRRPTLAERLAPHGGAVIFSNSSPGAAHMQDPDGHGTLHHRSGSHGPGLQPLTTSPLDGISYDADGDAQATRAFCNAVREMSDTRLFVLWICEPDHSQHALELGSGDHLDVLRDADRCVAEVAGLVTDSMRSSNDLILLASDHGHETVDEIVPVEALLIEQGFKDGIDSNDVVLASSGMGALIYIADAARDREARIADWLARQTWCQSVFSGPDLAKVGLPDDTHMRIAIGMAKRDAVNRHGVRGFGHVAADRFMTSDRIGNGQHGGLGQYETHPLLCAFGARATPGATDIMTRAVDIAPTTLEHLGLSTEGCDGKRLPLQ